MSSASSHSRNTNETNVTTPDLLRRKSCLEEGKSVDGQAQNGIDVDAVKWRERIGWSAEMMLTHRMRMPTLAHLTQTFSCSVRCLTESCRFQMLALAFPCKNLFAKPSLIDGASSTSQMIRPNGSDQRSEAASVHAGQNVWVTDSAGGAGLRQSVPLPFLFSASARSSKVTSCVRCVAGSRHPHRFGVDGIGSSGLHHLAGNVHSAHGLYTHPAAWLKLFLLARRRTSRTSTDLLSLKLCQPPPFEVTSPSADFAFFLCKPCLIQVSPPHTALFFFF